VEARRADIEGNGANAVNVFEFAEEFRLSLAKARKIKKRFPQIFDEADSAMDPLRATLAKGNRLTVPQLVELIENRAGLLELGKYATTAERELAALGNPQGQVAPNAVAANIMEAAKNEPEAVQILVDWLKEIIPAEPVEHAYIGTRLLLGVPDTIRKFEAPRIPRALLNARQHPDFAGWWRVEKSVSRNVTLYQKGTKKGFDL
jgi:hypothetical protein